MLLHAAIILLLSFFTCCAVAGPNDHFDPFKSQFSKGAVAGLQGAAAAKRSQREEWFLQRRSEERAVYSDAKSRNALKMAAAPAPAPATPPPPPPPRVGDEEEGAEELSQSEINSIVLSAWRRKGAGEPRFRPKKNAAFASSLFYPWVLVRIALPDGEVIQGRFDPDREKISQVRMFLRECLGSDDFDIVGQPEDGPLRPPVHILRVRFAGVSLRESLVTSDEIPVLPYDKMMDVPNATKCPL
jgi:hypothetical protein